MACIRNAIGATSNGIVPIFVLEDEKRHFQIRIHTTWNSYLHRHTSTTRCDVCIFHFLLDSKSRSSTIVHVYLKMSFIEILHITSFQSPLVGLRAMFHRMASFRPICFFPSDETYILPVWYRMIIFWLCMNLWIHDLVAHSIPKLDVLINSEFSMKCLTQAIVD